MSLIYREFNNPVNYVFSGWEPLNGKSSPVPKVTGWDK